MLTVWTTWLATRLRDERGQTSVEYAVVVVGVAIALAVILKTGVVNNLFNGFWQDVQNAL